MDPVKLGALLSIDSEPAPVMASQPTKPAKAIPRTYPAIPQGDDIEIDSLRRPVPVSTPTTTVTAGDLEASRPTTPSGFRGDQDDAVEVVESMWDPYMNRFRLLSACLMNFGNGLNDSALGALIPYIEKHVVPTMASYRPIC